MFEMKAGQYVVPEVGREIELHLRNGRVERGVVSRTEEMQDDGTPDNPIDVYVYFEGEELWSGVIGSITDIFGPVSTDVMKWEYTDV